MFVTHGHHYNVKMTLLNLSYKAKEVGADFVFFGHSHILGAELIENTLFLNPGSLLMPSGRTERTYAIVEKNG
ncbi:YfcE family phosphodiesterase, partial [Roseburia faecis]|nr:YfcE family phosphodiesterase [Roseburia faecis]